MRRGKTLSLAALGTLLAGEAVGSAPAGLASGVTAAALAEAASSSGMLVSLLKLMTTTNLKLGAAGAVLIAALGTPLVDQRHANNQLRKQNAALQQQVLGQSQQTRLLAKLRAENRRLDKLKLTPVSWPASEPSMMNCCGCGAWWGVLEQELASRPAPAAAAGPAKKPQPAARV